MKVRQQPTILRFVIVLGIMSGLLSLVFVMGHTKTNQPQTDSFASVSEQRLVDIQGPDIKGFEIDLRQPRLFDEVENITFDRRRGAKPFLCAKGSLRSNVLEGPFPLEAVSLMWSGEDGISAGVRAYLRTSKDNTSWSEWALVESAGDEFNSSGLFEGRVDSIPAQAKYIQFKIEFSEDRSCSPPAMDWIRLNYTVKVNGTKSSKEDSLSSSSEQLLTSSEQAVTAAAAASDPLVISRIGWACPDGATAPLARPEYALPITHLIVHHTLNGTRPANPTDYKAWVQNIWRKHHDQVVNGEKQGDIAYNLLIDPNGNVYEGRAGGVDAKGSHFSCHNSFTTGIALLGDFTSTAPTARALDALKQVLAWRAQAWVINPTATSIINTPDPTYPVRIIPNIAGHRDLNPVTWSCNGNNDDRQCPGNALNALLPGIRTAVAQIPGFSVQSDAVGYFLSQGQQVNVGLILKSYGGRTGAVSISTTGLPQGMSIAPVTANLAANGSIAATLVVKTTTSAQTGLFSPTITAVSGGQRRNVRISFNVNPASGTVAVNAVNNGQPWSGQVDYTIRGPQGVIIGLGVPGATSNLPPGQYSLTYNGRGPGRFTSVTPAATQNLTSGGRLTFTLNFGSSIPSPLSASCSASPATIVTGQNSVFSASVSGGTPPYSYIWSGAVSGNTASVSKVFATPGSFQGSVAVTDNANPKQSKTVNCSVRVNAVVQASFDLYDFVSTKTVQAGNSAAFDLYLQPQNGFSAAVNLSVVGLPSGASMISASQLTVSGSSAVHYALMIQTATGTPSGNFPLTVTATGQGVTRTASLSLTVTAAPAQPLSVSCRIVPNPITLGQGATISAQPFGGVPPFRYRINGIDMGTASSLLVMPSQTGTFSSSVTISDNRNQQASSSCSAQVISANPYVTGFNYTPSPAKATQVVSLNIFGGGFLPGTTQVWFVGPGCSSPGCQTNGVTVASAAYIFAQAVLNTPGQYVVNLRNGSGSWFQVGTVTVVR